MLKRTFLLQTLLGTLALSGISEASNLSVSPGSLIIKPGKDYDAIAYKRIYRTLKLGKNPGQTIGVKFSNDTGSKLQVTSTLNTCEDPKVTECSIALKIEGFEGNSSGALTFENTASNEILDTQSPFRIEAKLKNEPLRSTDKVALDDDDLQEGPRIYPSVTLANCDDLQYVDAPAVKECKAVYNILMNKKAFDRDAKRACADFTDSVEKSACEGTVEGFNLKTCSDMDSIASASCQNVHKAAAKTCDAYDFDCQVMQKVMHGYLDCTRASYSDAMPACIGYQAAYLEGISSNWLGEKFIPHAKANYDKNALHADNAPSLAFVNPKRVRGLGLDKEDAEFLVDRFPTLTRSVLLNTNFSKKENLSKEDLWKSIEEQLYPEQTVGYELECPGVRLDLTSGNDPLKLNDHLMYGEWGGYKFDEIITQQEYNDKKLKIDAAYEKHYKADMDYLTEIGVWTERDAFPFFNTYGQSLFTSQEKRLDIPLVDMTMESRYDYDHFPHIEMVTAPLTKDSQPLNHKNVMSYLSLLAGGRCNANLSTNFSSIKDWKHDSRQLKIPSTNKTLDFYSQAPEYFKDSPMACTTKHLNRCHVQSNVGVYYDQFFTDSLLVQSLGNDYPYDSDAVYHAAWTVAKRTFSVLQWDSQSDRMIDGRNHAAGVFTYFVYEMFVKSILYAGNFDFWKGTLAHLMKYELRQVIDTLSSHEKELFQQAVLMLWSQENFPSELLPHIKPTFKSLVKMGAELGTPKVMKGAEKYTDEIAKKANGIFKEIIWTIGLADDDTYNQAQYYSWGSVVSEQTDLEYFDPVDGTTKTRRAFVRGSDYATHNGAQIDIAKVIKPVTNEVSYGEHRYDRNYVVIETRFGYADFNQALFWRCHEDDHSTVLGHRCNL